MAGNPHTPAMSCHDWPGGPTGLTEKHRYIWEPHSTRELGIIIIF